MKTNKRATTYEIFKSYIPDLDIKTFNVLEYNGKLGKLFRGEKIELIKDNIFIEECWVRHDKFITTKQYVPVVTRDKNPYWAE